MWSDAQTELCMMYGWWRVHGGALPTTRPPKVHCCQKLSFRVLPTADDEAEVLAPAFTSSADVDGSAVFCPWPRVGSLEGTGGPSSFILRRNGTPPGLLPTSSQNVSENFCFAAANVMVGSASSAIFASAPSSARPVCDAEELGKPSVSSTPPPRSPPPLAATPTACLGPRNAHTWECFMVYCFRVKGLRVEGFEF
jgi:hypothetical protein